MMMATGLLPLPVTEIHQYPLDVVWLCSNSSCDVCIYQLSLYVRISSPWWVQQDGCKYIHKSAREREREKDQSDAENRVGLQDPRLCLGVSACVRACLPARLTARRRINPYPARLRFQRGHSSSSKKNQEEGRVRPRKQQQRSDKGKLVVAGARSGVVRLTACFIQGPSVDRTSVSCHD